MKLWRKGIYGLFNDPILKASFLKSLTTKTSEGVNDFMSQAEQIAWGAECGIPAAASLLLFDLAKSKEGYSSAAIADMLSAVPPGAELSTAPYHWIIWLIDPILTRWQRDNTEIALLDAGRSFSATVERAAKGEFIAREEWRQKSRLVGKAAKAVPAETGYGEILEAAAWDLSQMPGAVCDVIEAWSWHTRADSRLWGDAWSDEEQAEFNAAMDAHHAAAGLKAGPEPVQGDDKEDVAAWQQRYMSARTEIDDASKEMPIIVRFEAFRGKSLEEDLRRRASARAALKDIVADAMSAT